MMNRDRVISDISDDFKDANGFRPRGIWDFESMSDTELLALSDRVYEDARLAHKEEEEREAQSAVQFEELVLSIITMGAGNRQTALKWLLVAEDDDWPTRDRAGYFCYKYNLPMSYEAELKVIFNA